jgi:hypothetical protein
MSEFDDTLTQLFAEARETLPAEDFLQRVAADLNHARRRRAIGSAAPTLVAGGLAVAATPYVAEGSLAAVSHLGAWLPALAHGLTSPVVWLCSVAAAAWGLRRVRRMS